MYVKDDFINILSNTDYMTASFGRVLTTLAVPSFVMLSGAFSIKEENGNFNTFYHKTFFKIIAPTLIKRAANCYIVVYVYDHSLVLCNAGYYNDQKSDCNRSRLKISSYYDVIWSSCFKELYFELDTSIFYMAWIFYARRCD